MVLCVQIDEGKAIAICVYRLMGESNRVLCVQIDGEKAIRVLCVQIDGGKQ